MILLWGHPGDEPFARVLRTLLGRGAGPAVLDQRDLITVTGAEVRTSGGLRADLTAVSAAYLRPYDAARMPAVTRSPARTVRARAAFRAEASLLAWADHAGALVLNRPTPSAGNGAKAQQGRLIAAAGFAVPPGLVTDDAEALAAFADRHGEIVAKAGSGVRARVTRADAHDPGRLARLAACPTFFQAYVPGDDVRVHVVGDRASAVRIASDAVDYRVPEAATSQHRTDLPGDLADRCIGLAARLGLRLAGVDLRLAPDGTWYCFEVNPSPAFTYYADADTVADAIADLLLSRTP
ncbi:ATP-grasp domain-containing protein [Actinomadura gamaensis]|uniref:RimK family alpha-L-glutamate ligase n=1 Tax=Actinomadura gamaensis TaxID=1763541 RepID=A0ABV9UDW4_9ACTN